MGCTQTRIWQPPYWNVLFTDIVQLQSDEHAHADASESCTSSFNSSPPSLCNMMPCTGIMVHISQVWLKTARYEVSHAEWSEQNPVLEGLHPWQQWLEA